jgi:hypothetical protein
MYEIYYCDILKYTKIYYVYVISYVLTKYYMLCQAQSSAPRTRHYACEAVISQHVRTGSQSGNILLLSTCTVAAIPCCSFFPRYWLSGFANNYAEELNVPPRTNRQNPGVQPRSIEF